MLIQQTFSLQYRRVRKRMHKIDTYCTWWCWAYCHLKKQMKIISTEMLNACYFTDSAPCFRPALSCPWQDLATSATSAVVEPVDGFLTPMMVSLLLSFVFDIHWALHALGPAIFLLYSWSLKVSFGTLALMLTSPLPPSMCLVYSISILNFRGNLAYMIWCFNFYGHPTWVSDYWWGISVDISEQVFEKNKIKL